MSGVGPYVRVTPFESSSSSLICSILELSDTNVYAPQLRAQLGTVAHFCNVLVLELVEFPEVDLTFKELEFLE